VFKEPNKETIDRMTSAGTSALLDTLKDRRASMTQEIDKEIKFYENLLKEIKKDEYAKALSAVRAS
jgi:hypothetical protein